MKHCPECNKNYADPTLSFCLEDGAPLIFGSAVDEPETAILSDDFPGEAPTKHIDPHTISPTETRPFPGLLANAARSRTRLALLLSGIAVVGALALIAAYRYYSSSTTKQIESVAVLPFENGSGDPNLDYLADGVSESVIDRLSELPQLKVIARGSSFQYRGQVNLKDIANTLGVQAIVSGRLLKNGDNYVVRVDVMDVDENRQL